MKLATMPGPGRDGTLVVVDRALAHQRAVPAIAPTLQAALDDWARLAPALAAVYDELNAGHGVGQPFEPARALAPLPRAYQWVDASAYVNHVELVRRARGAELPASYWHDPLVYQGGSDDLLGANADIVLPDAAHGIDLEGEVAVILTDVALGTPPAATLAHVALLMLVNDVSLRHLVPGELAKGFGFYQSKPASAFSPVAITPDELGTAWHGGKVHRPLTCHVNDRLLGAPEAGVDMTFGFDVLIAHLVRTRRLGAGTILGSGTVSNRDRSRGSACLAEQRVLETLDEGAPRTPFLGHGDRVRIEMFDGDGASLFGAIDQRVVVRGG